MAFANRAARVTSCREFLRVADLHSLGAGLLSACSRPLVRADRRRMLATVVGFLHWSATCACHGNTLEPTACSLQARSGGTSPEYWCGWVLQLRAPRKRGKSQGRRSGQRPKPPFHYEVARRPPRQVARSHKFFVQTSIAKLCLGKDGEYAIANMNCSTPTMRTSRSSRCRV